METNNIFPACMASECTCFVSDKFKPPLLYNKDDPFQYVAYTQKWIKAYLDELQKHQNKDKFFNTNHFDFVEARELKFGVDHHVHTLKFFEKMYIMNKVNGNN